MEPTCPRCHTQVRQTDYFCFNCGINLRPAPPPTSPESQIMLYLGSFFLPPMGIVWGWKYVRSTETKIRIIGYTAILLTLVSLVIAVRWTINTMNTVNQQVNQLQNLQGL